MARRGHHAPMRLRQLKLVRQGDRVLCYHQAPERALYALAEVTRDPYPDPHDHEGKGLVADLRALERLPRAGDSGGTARQSRGAQTEIPEKCAPDHFPGCGDEYQEILRMAGIVAAPGLPLP